VFETDRDGAGIAGRDKSERQIPKTNGRPLYPGRCLIFRY
jgi:hypothetical protein